MTKEINFYKLLLERIWSDEQFKNCFIADPKPILCEFGVKVPKFLKQIEVHEDRPKLRNYILPIKEQLERYMEEQNPIIAQVIRQALADNAFKAKLLQNPNTGMKEATGEDLPKDLTICFYEDTLTVRHLVIPINPDNQQLNDSQLDMVAGGIAFPILKQPQPYILGLIAIDKF
ncbi:NHLP leader peptide family RiPP precursor [Brasilonema sp. UFV-L1]|uniref:NHLP leader peptide family RiPP precursor n=1 Tax=Brasilonema sp. UFV-L1 TaxID=2234130 RepID=UPI00145DC5E8|nr:NHLP leader peptide family RiPP precursor [Brasilonema sp. UFV-L1]